MFGFGIKLSHFSLEKVSSKKKIMQGLTDSEKFILNQEFPDLSLSGDDEIERYFIYRKQGREKEAIFLYNNKLRVKYPNEALRIALISAYRKKTPFSLLF